MTGHKRNDVAREILGITNIGPVIKILSKEIYEKKANPGSCVTNINRGGVKSVFVMKLPYSMT